VTEQIASVTVGDPTDDWGQTETSQTDWSQQTETQADWSSSSANQNDCKSNDIFCQTENGRNRNIVFVI
jgi:hypothetical protein